jgi:tetratricopeptide (TPR) repeat protein
MGVQTWEYALTQCRAILTYIRLFFWPAGQSLSWRLPTLHSIGDGAAAVYAIGLIAVISTMCFLYSRLKVVSFGILLFLLALMPTSSLVPLQENLAERRMYLPIAGLIIAILGVAGNLRISAKVRTAGYVLLLAAAALVTHARTHIWSDDLLMWQNVIARDPGNAQAHSWLASGLAMRGDCAGAAREYKSSVQIEGLTLLNGTNLATAYECSNEPDLALDTWRQLVKIHPDANAYNRIGYREATRNHLQLALDAFNSALRVDPNNATAYAYRGTAELAAHQTAAAKEDLLRAIALDPGNAAAAAGMSLLAKEQ